MFDFLDFRPNKKGMRRALGDLEAEIMEKVWDRGVCTVRDIYETLRLQRKIAYTTVMTIMTRLDKKGLLCKEREGAAFVYRPALSREEFGREVTSEVLSGLLDSFGREVFAQLVEKASRGGHGDIEELEKLIADRKKMTKE